MTGRNEGCEKCVFFQAFRNLDYDDPGDDHGRCLRHAPRPITKVVIPADWRETDWEPSTKWPRVSKDNWCGEWREDKDPDG